MVSSPFCGRLFLCLHDVEETVRNLQLFCSFCKRGSELSEKTNRPLFADCHHISSFFRTPKSLSEKTVMTVSTFHFADEHNMVYKDAYRHVRIFFADICLIALTQGRTRKYLQIKNQQSQTLMILSEKTKRLLSDFVSYILTWQRKETCPFRTTPRLLPIRQLA